MSDGRCPVSVVGKCWLTLRVNACVIHANASGCAPRDANARVRGQLEARDANAVRARVDARAYAARVNARGRANDGRGRGRATRVNGDDARGRDDGLAHGNDDDLRRQNRTRRAGALPISLRLNRRR